MFWAPPAPQPVNYHHQVARIFAYHCNGCHGEAGGLSLRSYEEAMAGGNKGKVIVGGNAGGSLLIHFLEGRRGEAHRMPAEGAALSSIAIATIRQWINEGASPGNELPANKRTLTNVRMERGKVTRIICRMPVQAYLVLKAIHPATNIVLWTEVASIKTPKEGNDSGQPGDLLHWDLVPAPNWPALVTVQLAIEYAADDSAKVEFSAAPPGSGHIRIRINGGSMNRR